VKADAGSEALPKEPPMPDTILQLPVPTVGVLAERVIDVRPHVAASV